MKNLLVISLLFSTLSFADITGVKKLQWIDPYGRQPIKYSKWFKKHVDKSVVTNIGKVYEKIFKDRQNLVDVIVNKNIYPDIAIEIDTFINDLISAGYTVQLDTIIGMSHTTLRAHLASLTDLVGAVFVGELPVAWFETIGFGYWEEFPHDLYFCDLDGTYIDADGDGVYDNHTGNVAPEIWVGRIYARNLTWDNEIRLLKNYFHKNHQYRTSGSSLPQRALSFVEDDWNDWTDCGLSSVYPGAVVVINDIHQTIASEYRTQLNQGYEWIHLCAHSSPWGHTFKDSMVYRGSVFNYEIFTLAPQALFYNLFACSGTRFVEENHSAGWYIFVEPYGLLAVGSTKTGSMLYFEDFYNPLGTGECIGDAFKSWFTIWAEYDPHGWSWDWFYGMNILGDPTLKPKGQTVNRITNNNFPFKDHALDWEPPEIIVPDPESDAFPKITTNTDGKIWVILESGRSATNGRSEIYSAFRDADVWSNAMNIGPMVYWDYCPDIDTDSQSRPIAVWAGYSEGQYDLYYSIYTGSWSSRQLVHTTDPGYDIKPTMIKDSDGYLWVTWESRRDLDLNIYASYFNGTSWSLAQQVTTNSADEFSAKMVVDSIGRPWVFYSRRFNDRSEIWGNYYTGSQWLETGPISNNQERAYHPTSAVDEQGNIWVAWQSSDNDNVNIYATYFNGSVWALPVQITSGPESNLFPDLATANNGTVWLVYQSKSGTDWNIYSSYCDDFTWSSSLIVTNLVGADINPQITCDNENELWVCWQSYSTGNWEIMVSHRSGFGVSEIKNESVNSDFSVLPTIFSDNLRITTERLNQKIKIYDVKGSLIKTLSSNDCGFATWSPQKIPSGTYFVIVKNTNSSIVKKVLFLK